MLAGMAWPAYAVTMRMLDADGREVQSAGRGCYPVAYPAVELALSST